LNSNQLKRDRIYCLFGPDFPYAFAVDSDQLQQTLFVSPDKLFPVFVHFCQGRLFARNAVETGISVEFVLPNISNERVYEINTSF
jgi:hypothetical protein